MRVADLGGYRSGNPPVGRVTEVPSGDPTIPLALNPWAAFEGCVRADDEVAHTRNIVSLIRLCATHTASGLAIRVPRHAPGRRCLTLATPML